MRTVHQRNTPIGYSALGIGFGGTPELLLGCVVPERVGQRNATIEGALGLCGAGCDVKVVIA